MAPANKKSKTTAAGEIIYVLTNPAMPNLVKIGATNNLEQEVKRLSEHSGIPAPFKVYYACTVNNPNKVEKGLQELLFDFRENSGREFFRIHPERIKAALALVKIKDIPSGKKDNISHGKVRKPPFRFSMAGLSPGAVLTYVHDKSVTAIVMDDRRIKFEGKPTYLSTVTKELLKKATGKNHEAINGPSYWLYKGKILNDIRIQQEQADAPALSHSQGKEKERKMPFRFSMIGIKKGTVINYFLDENITATVLDDRHIEFRGKKHTVTGAARKLLRRPPEQTLNGTWCWHYKGELLAEIRLRMGK